MFVSLSLQVIIVLAGLLFNLLIAVVQNAFEIMVRNSTRDWEDGLTVLMEDGFLRNLEDLRPGDDDGNDSDGDNGGSGGGGGGGHGSSKDGRHGQHGQGKPGAGGATAGKDTGRRPGHKALGGKLKAAAAAAAAAAGKATEKIAAAGGASESETATAAAIASGRMLAAQEAFAEQLRQLQERIRYDDDDAVKRSKLLEYLRALIDREVTILTDPMYRDWCKRRYGCCSAEEAKRSEGRLTEGEPRASPARPESNWLSLRGQMLQWREFSDGSSDGGAPPSGGGNSGAGVAPSK